MQHRCSENNSCHHSTEYVHTTTAVIAPYVHKMTTAMTAQKMLKNLVLRCQVYNMFNKLGVVVADQYATFVFFNAIPFHLDSVERASTHLWLNLTCLWPFVADHITVLLMMYLTFQGGMMCFSVSVFVCLETIDIGPALCCNLAGLNCWLLLWSFACWDCCWIFAADTRGATA